MTKESCILVGYETQMTQTQPKVVASDTTLP